MDNLHIVTLQVSNSHYFIPYSAIRIKLSAHDYLSDIY